MLVRIPRIDSTARVLFLQTRALAQVFIALDDVACENGPTHFVPSSHGWNHTDAHMDRTERLRQEEVRGV